MPRRDRSRGEPACCAQIAAAHRGRRPRPRGHHARRGCGAHRRHHSRTAACHFKPACGGGLCRYAPEASSCHTACATTISATASDHRCYGTGASTRAAGRRSPSAKCGEQRRRRVLGGPQRTCGGSRAHAHSAAVHCRWLPRPARGTRPGAAVDAAAVRGTPG